MRLPIDAEPRESILSSGDQGLSGLFVRVFETVTLFRVPCTILRRLLLALVALWLLTTGLPAARASGCHVPDRAVLETTFSWDQPQRDVSKPTEAPMVPPALRRAHCPSEPASHTAPQFIGSAVVRSPGMPRKEPLDRRNLVVWETDDCCQPIRSRLDRPPRPLA
jgi:hypothetical protein